MIATGRVSHFLERFAAPGAGGLVLGTASGYLAAALAEELGHEVSYEKLIAKGSGLGALFGIFVKLLGS